MRNQVTAVLAIASLLMLTNAPGAQTDEGAASIAPQSPAATTSALYSALATGVELGEGDAPDTNSIYQAMIALGYITGVEQMLSSGLVNRSIRICDAAEIRNDALARIVTAYVDNHPQAYSLPPAVVVTAAFEQAFPCHNLKMPKAKG